MNNFRGYSETFWKKQDTAIQLMRAQIHAARARQEQQIAARTKAAMNSKRGFAAAANEAPSND